MKEETNRWLKYAEENLEAAKLLLNSHLYNPALYNVQQTIEKSPKSVFIELGIKLKKSHSIGELKNILSENQVLVELTDDECDLLDSIYLPSKYPIVSALPDFHPDEKITKNCIEIADETLSNVKSILSE